MASTIDFSTMNDEELLYGYQRVNRSRFPDNFVACAEEIAKRGLAAPEKFEICPISAGAIAALQKLSRGLSTLTNLMNKKDSVSEA
jgi:hypothetical protein